MIQQWTYGSIDYEAATDVQQQLLHAELELAQTPAEELAVAEKHAKIAGQTLQTTQAMFSNGRVNEMSLLRAKSEHLQLEMLSAKFAAPRHPSTLPSWTIRYTSCAGSGKRY